MYLSWLTSLGKATLSTPPPCWVMLSLARATNCSRVKSDLATPTTGHGSVPRRTMFCRAGNIFLKARSPVAPKKTSASEIGAPDSGFREAAWLGLDMEGVELRRTGSGPSNGLSATDAPGGHRPASERQRRTEAHCPVKAGEQRRGLERTAKIGRA